MKKVFLLFNLLTACLCLPDASKIVDRINYARTNPQDFATLISSRYSQLPGAEEAIEYLKAAPSLSSLTRAHGVNAYAQLQANYLRSQSLILNPYAGCSGATIQARATQVGTWTNLGENVATEVYDEELTVVTWVIDYDTDIKLNRRNILNSQFDSIGVGRSDGKASKNIVVVDFAGSFVCTSPCPNVPALDTDYGCTGKAYTYGNGAALLGIKSIFSLLSLLGFVVLLL